MKYLLHAFSLSLMLIFFQSGLFCKEKHISIAIQPLGKVNASTINIVTRGIKKLYNVDITILPSKSLPLQAYYKPRNRYRAEKILRYLEETNKGRYTKIIALTKRDISTTKGSIKDWGIFGLGSLGGESCVVSTFRLRQGEVSNFTYYERLVKVVNHELGHTFGINHCPNSNCLMEDAKGTIKTVDRETGEFCEACARELVYVLK